MVDDPLPEGSTASLIGIVVAICGNILISLALNCQKLAHRQLELHNERRRAEAKAAALSPNGRLIDIVPEESSATPSHTNSQEPVLNSRSYGALPPRSGRFRNPLPRFFRRSRSRDRSSLLHDHNALPVPLSPSEGNPLMDLHISPVPGNSNRRSSSPSRLNKTTSEQENSGQLNESEYLKSKLWWFGFFLMNVGELGNFLSYAFAPASVVAPLGTFALIANCVFAPIMLGEQFRKRDLLGIALAIIGALTVVAASKSSDVRLDPAALLHALKQHIFIIYTIIMAVVGLLLGLLAEGRAGRKWVIVDVGLCALFGGYTVLATKALSTLLSLEWIEIFEEWITYPTVVVLVGTGIGQIKYLNRALMKFDSKAVIPTQFVLFNLAAIVGSAILYRDFEDISLHQFITFIYGCATTFLGVFFLTSTTPPTIDREGDIEAPAPSTRVQVAPGVHTPRANPILRHKASTASLSLSPGQYLLLAAPTSPTRAENGDLVPGSAGGRRKTVHFMENTPS